MSVFKKKPEMARLSFLCPVETSIRLKAVEDKAKAKGWEFTADADLLVALNKKLARAEKELAAVQA